MEPLNSTEELQRQPKANVLLVDDRPTNLVVLRSILEDLGQNLVEAHSGDEALRHLQQAEFAVVLLDIQMPGLNGFETAKLLRDQEQNRHTPVIFLTAYDSDRAQLEQGYSLGAVDFLTKPLVPVILKAKVASFVKMFQEKERTKREADQLRLLIHGTTEYAIFMLDPDGNVITWNPGAERIKGYRADEIVGKHFSCFYPQDAKDRGWPKHELEVAKAKGRFEDEGWRVRNDGTQFWANVVITALRDTAGNLRGFSKITRDMTEKKQAEENARRLLREEEARRVAEENTQVIQEQRERLQVTLASIGDAVISTDAKGRVTFLNPVAEQLTGWSHEAANGKPLVDVLKIVNEQTRQPVENPALRALQEGVIVGLANHTILIARDGTERPIDDSAAPMRDVAGIPIGAVLVFRDITERKQSESALRESEARKAAILQTALDCIITMDHEGNVVEFNPAAEKTFGYKRDQVIGRQLSDLIIPSYLRERHRNGLAHYLSSGEGPVLGKRIEMPALRADGTEFPIELAITRIPTAGPPLFSAYLRDISERQRQERHRSARLAVTQVLALAATVHEAATGLLQAVCESLGWDVGLIWTLGSSDDVLRCLESWHQPHVTITEFETASRQRIFRKGEGLPGSVWATGKSAWILDVVHSDNFPRLAIAAKDGVHGAFACPIVAAGKTLGIIEFFSQRIQEPDAGLLEMMDTIAGQIGQFMERKQAEEQRKRSEQTSRFLADASATLAALVDYESTLQKVASLAVPFFADWTTVDLAENDGSLRRVAVAHVDPSKVALAHELNRRYPPDPSASQGASHILRTGQPELVTEITDALLVESVKDEELLLIMRELGLKSYMGVPLTVRGKTIGVITFIAAESGHRYDDTDLSVAQDLADRAAIAIENAQLYRELREADRRKDEFLATLAHELRNPLAPIRNSLQILKMPRVDAEAIERSRETMDRQVQHLVRLVDDLLDVSRVMKGKIELRKEQVELASIVARAVETTQPLIEAQGHELSVTLPQESLLLEVDPVRLAQVVGNLLTNAAKYTEANGRIWLSAEREGNEAILRIRDNGIGIAPNMLPHLFELFMQVDHAAARSQGGLGIGLTLVKNLVEMHEGTVEAHSPGLGEGSEFVVRLQRSAQKPEEPQRHQIDPKQKGTSPSGHRVLVVDDNHDAADSLAMLLRLKGHHVRVAHNGPAALEMTKDYQPELVLLDIGMPGMDGYEVARRLRQQPELKNVVLAAVTGWGQQEDRRRSADAGFNHHLIKPLGPNALEGLLAALNSSKG